MKENAIRIKIPFNCCIFTSNVLSGILMNRINILLWSVGGFFTLTCKWLTVVTGISWSKWTQWAWVVKVIEEEEEGKNTYK